MPHHDLITKRIICSITGFITGVTRREATKRQGHTAAAMTCQVHPRLSEATKDPCGRYNSSNVAIISGPKGAKERYTVNSSV